MSNDEKRQKPDGQEIPLGILERFTLLQSMQEKSDRLTMIVVESVLHATALTPAENKKWNVVRVDNQWQWSPEGAAAQTPIHYSDTQLSVIRERLRALNDAKEITIQLLTVLEKFSV